MAISANRKVMGSDLMKTQQQTRRLTNYSRSLVNTKMSIVKIEAMAEKIRSGRCALNKDERNRADLDAAMKGIYY